ncbi:MAG TPA: protein kinase [Streptosporangiaceae bacterium]|nr:protein kinase [Streptosporangiaceae bacterium]
MKGVQTSGDRIGRYRLLERLGEGGMGVVHLAEDQHGRKVAIKVLRPAVAGDVTALRRLAREVDTMRRVHSPYVAEILDADVTAEPPYVVTQYVPGSTLEEMVFEQGPLFGSALQRLAAGLARALAAIHSAGVIHRDLKPGNVMFLDGEPIVIDFGIAQAVDSTRLTATGLVIGTPGYLAPEIIEGEEAGAPADVHSWASTVAFAATGRPPFGTGSFESVFYKIMEGRPDLDGVPDALLPLIRSAMSRHPAERPSAPALAELARRIDLDVTAPDFPRPDLSPAAAPETGPHTERDARRDARHDARPAGPTPPPAQPKDFKGLLPPAAPPPAPQPAPSTVPQARVAGPRPRDPYAPQGPYAPVAAHRPYQPSGYPAPGAEPAKPVKPAKPYGWYRVLGLLALAGTLGLALVAPMMTLLVVLAVVLVLRAGDRAARDMESKRTRRGPRGGDAVAATLKSPLKLPRAVLTTVFVAPVGALAAAVVLFIVMVARPDFSVRRDLAISVAVFIVVHCLGPGSDPIRRQLARTWGVIAPRREPAIVIAVCLALIAAFLLTLAPTQVPDLRPFDVDWSVDGLRRLSDVLNGFFG